jgi:hypothetical protein
MKILPLALLLLTAAAPAMAQQVGNTANPFGRHDATPSSVPAPTRATPQRAPTQRASDAAHYDTLPAAQQACGSDPVVWGNLRSHAYHGRDDRLFGKTKRGTYLCQSAADRGGFHAAGQRRQRN